jgi:hypothetical protein
MSKTVYDKITDDDLYTTTLQVTSDDPRSNSLIQNVNGNISKFPSTMKCVVDLKQPIENIYDITMTKFFYTNGFHRITNDNNTFPLVVWYLPVDPSKNAMYVVQLAIPPGNYNAETMQNALNKAVQDKVVRGGDKYSLTFLKVKDLVKNDSTSPYFLDAEFETNDKLNVTPFNLNDAKHPTKTVITLKFLESGVAIFIPPLELEGFIKFDESLAPVLGFTLDKPSVVPDNVDYNVFSGVADPVVQTVSEGYYTVDYSKRKIYVESDAISNNAEFPPSFNGNQRSNVVYTLLTTGSSLEALYHTNPHPETTRIRMKERTRISAFDFQLLDQDFKEIRMTPNDAYDMVFSIRLLKRRV